jgi:alpha-beta hydrolase superfamily lysophospholipase
MGPRVTTPTAKSAGDAKKNSRNPIVPFTIEEGMLTQRAGGAPDIAYQLSLPPDARAALILVHGYGEHSARYRRVVDRFSHQGIATALLDLRGHGLSGGVRGHCDHFSEYHQDLADVLAVFREHIAHLPLFGFGHSFGGLVATTWALAHPGAWRGLVLSSPYFGLALQVSPVKKALGQIASVVMPTLGVPAGLRGADLTHDETIARAYDNDPLNVKAATARWFTESNAAQRDLYARASQLRLPVLLVQAGADKVASASAARAVFDRMGSPDKTYDERPGLFHELLNEPKVWTEIADQMSDWVLARI